MAQLERLLESLPPARPASAKAPVEDQPILDPAERVDALEKYLRSVPQSERARVRAFLLRLMSHSEEGIRITAMNWLVHRYNRGREALEKGLMDRSDPVRLAAIEHLRDRGIDSKTLDNILEAAKRRDLEGIRALLPADSKPRR